MCKYFDFSGEEPKPMCINGHVLHRVGMDVSQLDGYLNPTSFTPMVEDLQLPVEPEAVRFCA